MKTTLLKFRALILLLLVVVGLVGGPIVAIAQDADSVAAQDNSSSFNDSVQFDDMEPIFYEAADDEAETVSEEGGSGMMLYVGIAVALIIILIVLKKVGKKKS